jgi:phage terminase small subunit
MSKLGWTKTLVYSLLLLSGSMTSLSFLLNKKPVNQEQFYDDTLPQVNDTLPSQPIVQQPVQQNMQASVDDIQVKATLLAQQAADAQAKAEDTAKIAAQQVEIKAAYDKAQEAIKIAAKNEIKISPAKIQESKNNAINSIRNLSNTIRASPSSR